jgi:hypothetical protein
MVSPAKDRGKGKHRASGLWQYTESGLWGRDARTAGVMQEEGVDGEGRKQLDSEEGDLSRVLGGKTK